METNSRVPIQFSFAFIEYSRMLIQILAIILILISLKFKPPSKGKSKTVPSAGPWGFPLLGHLPLLSTAPHKRLAKWGEVYGPIYAIRLGSHPVVVLNDTETIRTACNKVVLSGRPDIKVLRELTKNRAGFVIRHDPISFKTRTFIRKTLKDIANGAQNMEDMLLANLRTFLSFMEDESLKKEQTSISELGCVSLTTKYLWSILLGQSENIDMDRLAKECLEALYLVTKLPLTTVIGMLIPKSEQWFPSIFGFERAKKDLGGIVDFFAEHVRKQKPAGARGQQPVTLAQALLDKQESGEFNNQEDSWYVPVCIAELVMGGTDNIGTMLEWLIYYVVKHPQAAEKLRAEIKHFLGKGASMVEPSVNDRASMLYVEAFIMEALRKSSNGPFGIPRLAIEDAELCGYFIPKGTMILTNLYAAHYSEEAWGDPEVFRPERFIDVVNGKLKSFPDFMPFGVGRRYCVGDVIARNQLFLFLVSVIQKFDVRSVGDLPPEDGPFGLTLHPNHFNFKVSLIRDELRTC